MLMPMQANAGVTPWSEGGGWRQWLLHVACDFSRNSSSLVRLHYITLHYTYGKVYEVIPYSGGVSGPED